MPRQNKTAILNSLLDQGFDQSYKTRDGVRPSCSQCQAVCINGVACHETGCPNGRRYTCQECGTIHRDREDAGACCANW